MIVLALLLATPALALDPSEILADPAKEARARALSAELRCLQCQNQSIDDSNAPLAKDLRRLVRERITAGDSDDQVMRHIVARYGEFVRLRPSFGLHTLLLWTAPLIVLGLTAWAMLRRRRIAPVDAGRALSADEKRRLDELMSK